VEQADDLSSQASYPVTDKAALVLAPEGAQASLMSLVRRWGYQPVPAATLGEARHALERQEFAFTIVDEDAADRNRPEAIARLRRHRAAGAIVVLGGSGWDAILPLERAAVVAKPLLPEQLSATIRALLGEGKSTTSDASAAGLSAEIALWRSARMRAVWEVIQQAARVDVTVLVCGETGTGKDVVARAIHRLSARHDQPFVKVNCAAVPRELLESELFGHERGAFTGAHQTRIGKFEAADRGTVFLDEIGDLHPALQAKLLHVLQDGAFSRVGGRSTIKVDVRVLAATNKNLEDAVLEGRFRDDLYYRLNVIQVTVPPLRERPEEIPLLTEYFVTRYSKEFSRAGFRPTPGAMERLLRHRYPGNVRELENIVKRMIIFSDPDLTRTPLRATGEERKATGERGEEPGPRPVPPPTLSLKDIARGAAQSAERQAIAKVLEETGWNRTRTAKMLNISYRALLYKMKDAGFTRAESGPRP
jgi:two-component system response regulator AtoC